MVCILGALILAFMPLPLVALERPANVMLLNSYHQGLQWTDEQTKPIIERIPNSAEQQRYIEYLDWKRYPTEENLQHQYTYLKTKYSDIKIDLLITTDDAALEFALNHRQELFSDAPIVFSGVFRESAEKLLQGEDRVTGVYEVLDAEGTINLALNINPQIKNIYVFHDQTESGEFSGQEILKAVVNLKAKNNIDELNTSCLADLNFEEILRIVAALKEDSIVIIGTYGMDNQGNILAPEIFANLVSVQSAVPVYSVYEFLLGSGITGGSLLNAHILGEQAADLGLKILQGEDIRRLPVLEGQYFTPGFDYTQLVRFGISERALPENSLLVNKPLSFLEDHRREIISIMVVFSVLIGFLIVLLFNIDKRKENELLLLTQKEELTAVYEELTASEEELRQQFDEMVVHQQALRGSEERYKLALEATRDTIWEWNIVENHRIYSGNTLEMLGYSGEELAKYESWQRLVHPDDLKRVENRLNVHLRGKSETYACEYRILSRDGNYKWIRSNGKALFNDGKPYKMVGSHRDITELKEQEEKMIHLAYHDFLTNLPNRALLKEIMENEIQKAEETAACHALLFLDVDNFKVINDSLGHSVGDELLILLSNDLKEIFGSTHVVAKYGGDEFIILLRNLPGTYLAEDYAQRVIRLFEKPIIVENYVCNVSVSIGIVYYPADGQNFEELFKNVDIAMYKAKQLGKRKYVIFNEEMKDEVVQKARIQNNLQQAIEREEFILHYQPQADLRNGQIVGFEALVRWQSAENGLIPPDKFISVAEETGHIIPMGEWVLKTACCFMKKLHDLGYEEFSISVNISSVQLRQGDFVNKVLTILKETGLDPAKLVLEITETVLIEFLDPHILTTLNLLQEKGIIISLDDFGQGYSSLNYIRELPISTLKIDKSFIANIKRDNSENITGAIIILAHRLGLKVVAEGVEIPEQLDYLRDYRCDEIQGYYLSKPVPEEAVFQMLTEQFPGGRVW